MSMKLILDSSADLVTMESIPFGFAPLKLCTADREFIDNEGLNVEEMVDFLFHYKGRSFSSCPNAEDFLKAFGEAEEIICITITGNLSGSYNCACAAKKQYEASYPDRRVEVVDSLTAGPEVALMAEKVAELYASHHSFEEIVEALRGYKTELLFVLEAMKNLSNNGRVSRSAATMAGLLGIRAVGRASDEGTLELLTKSRGTLKTTTHVLDYLKQYGFKGGKLRIHHCFNEDYARTLSEAIVQAFPSAKITLHPTRGLCSFYAERGGLLMGFEV